MDQNVKRIEAFEQPKSVGVFGRLCLLLIVIFTLFWSVFGLWTYFMDGSINYAPQEPFREKKLVLSGNDDAYFVSLPEQEILLIESASPLRILDVQIAFVLKFSKDQEVILAKLPQIQDIFNTYFRTITLNELQESGRLFYMKEALLERVNSLIFPTQIQDVLFQKIIVKETQ